MKRKFVFMFLTAAFVWVAQAQDIDLRVYYQRALGLRGAALQDSLHEIIKNHDRISYENLRYAFVGTDTLPSGEVGDIYSNCSYRPEMHGSNLAVPLSSGCSAECQGMQREHSFCASWMGTSRDQIQNEPFYSDMFQLYPTDGFVNQVRNDNPYGMVAAADRTFDNGAKLGENTYPNAPSVTAYEPIDEYKGDIARSFLYMAVRYKYEDETFGESSPMTYRSQPNEWTLEMLRAWHIIDPVSDKERNRNTNIYQFYQHNRNPFIDCPELVELIWGDGYDTFTLTPDTLVRPVVTACQLENLSSLRLEFDSNMRWQTYDSQNMANFFRLAGIRIDSAVVDTTNAVILHFPALQYGRTYYLTVSRLQALSGTYMRDTVLTITSGDPAFLAWTFDDLDSVTLYQREIPADYGANCSAAKIYFDGTHGSSYWENTWLQLYSVGTALCDPRALPNKSKPLGFKNKAANGSSFVVTFPTRLYRQVAVSFASASTPAGFNDIALSWGLSDSAINQPFANISVDSNDTKFKSYLYQMGGLFDEQDTVFLKIQLDGATHHSGNTKFDNICVHGSKCTETIVYNDTVPAGATYSKHGFQVPTTLAWAGDYFFSRRVTLPDACDSICTLALFVIADTTTAVVPTITRPTFQLFPNPATTTVTVAGRAMNEIFVINLQGQTCGRYLVAGKEQYSFSVADLPAGIYIVQTITLSGNVATQKLVVD